MFEIGFNMRPLWPFYDCPDGAKYLNATLYDREQESGWLKQGVVCVFVHLVDRPIRSHYEANEEGFAAYGGARDTALVVRAISTIDNYDYIFDYFFHKCAGFTSLCRLC
jgi:primary-amine oxidase